MKIVFATGNLNKLKEIKQILGDAYEVLGLADIGCHEEIPETAETIEGNAILKAQYVKEHYGYDCFADDTGLEVAALNGAPGVYSARYAGENKNAEANMEKLLTELAHKNNRQAQFKTVIALVQGEALHTFEGIAKGAITKEKQGEQGFGYDPVFQPEGYRKTFAELSSVEKNSISHRGLAMKKLVAFLQK
ncbi:XTP/dITP diphosphohydrolase [Pustulibacterium marinum]|uniref:dITP/XTP pyrophosphatase n=1 Tax=Pustulibacterium marinum TaxID=1224947 RepID=A0A1I7FT90_9FLAO|nr:non-canonical purine NTP diphosphatase [Pustulibacterium marinum]SFU39383.1 XTP/dITP diphosphohydrolase [Pustulibacterium marinum]